MCRGPVYPPEKRKGEVELKVCKFGGSSVANAAQIRKVRDIIQQDNGRRLIVVSAPGKRSGSDAKITDLLYTCHSKAAAGESFEDSFGIIKSRYLEIAADLEVGIPLEAVLDEIEEKIESGASADYAASRGEFLSGMMIADFLGAEFLDAEKVVRLTDDGQVDESSYRLLQEWIRGEGLVVLPGFYGRSPEGELKTFSRGGSDISGAIAARAVNAEVYENWTDVSGILMADPRIAENPKPIGQISYREIREMASIGANVFHEEAIAPVKSVGIPIHVMNTNDPGAAGTFIVAERDTDAAPVVGVSGKGPYRKIVAEKYPLNRYPGFSLKVEEKLKSVGCSAEFSLKGFDTLTLFVTAKDGGEKNWEKICRELMAETKADGCTAEGETMMIGVVGEGLMKEPRIPGYVLTALESAGIPVEAVNYGGSQVTMLIAIPSDRYKQAVQVLTETVSAF
jgi:aspartate kinase